MNTKLCGNCKKGKSIEDFYPHKRYGLQSICKECKRELGRTYNKTPKRKAYNQQFIDKLKREGYYKDYLQKPEVKEKRAKQQREYSRTPRLRIRYLARWYTKRMVRNGTIKRETCAICDKEQTQAHHPNYNEPLLIVWLCADCHRQIHKSKAEGK